MHESLFHRINRTLLTKPQSGRRLRLSHKLMQVGRWLVGLFSILAFLAAVAGLVSAVIYVGFDSAAINRSLLMRALHTSQIIFVLSIIVNAVFTTRPRGIAGIVRMLADVMVLLTLTPMIIPGSAHWPIVHFLFGRAFFIIAIFIYSVAEICGGIMMLLGRRTNPSLILASSFIVFILAGSLVLMLPKCLNMPLDYIDSLFVAASAVSMTGLTTVNISEVFTPLGWCVLAVLMEIGALGVLTFTSFFSLFFAGGPNIYNQMLMRDFIYSKSIGALVPMMLYILAFTVSVELIGAIGIYFTLPEGLFSNFGNRIGCCIFHSIAAFTNSGLSTLPDGLANTAIFNGNQLFYLVMSLMIFAGGIGFPNLVNFKDAVVQYFKHLKCIILRRPHRRRVHIYDLNSKLVLTTTVMLFVIGAIGFFILERNNTLAGMPLSKQIVQSIFYSATPRSAGFTPINPSGFLNITLIMLMFLMWIGGSSQSMAGGIKVNTFATALLNLKALVSNKKGVAAYGRQIAPASVRRANGTIILSLLTIFGFTVGLMLAEPDLPLRALAFESLSAITTNGMSLGITSSLSVPSKIMLTVAMFLGRVGFLSLLTGIAHTDRDSSSLYPSEDIIIS